MMPNFSMPRPALVVAGPYSGCKVRNVISCWFFDWIWEVIDGEWAGRILEIEPSAVRTIKPITGGN